MVAEITGGRGNWLSTGSGVGVGVGVGLNVLTGVGMGVNVDSGPTGTLHSQIVTRRRANAIGVVCHTIAIRKGTQSDFLGGTGFARQALNHAMGNRTPLCRFGTIPLLHRP